MCEKLKECIEEQEPDDCGRCRKYTQDSRKVYSAQLSFGRKQNIQLCDCIIQCDGFYIVLEYKGGRLNSEKIKDAINQLNNCEINLKNMCGSLKVFKALIYKEIDIPVSNRQNKLAKLRNESIEIICVKTYRGEEICQFIYRNRHAK